MNVERDLDPAVELMNTDGPLAVDLFDRERSTAFDDRSTTDRERREWTVAAGVARSVNLFESTAGRAYAVQTIG